MPIALLALLAFSQTPQIEWQPYQVKAGEKVAEAELGKLKVAENRTKANGKTIELAFVRLKSTTAKPGYPLVYLDGGPGGSGISMANVPGYYETFEKFREAGDVIFLDQRGVGLSKPMLAKIGGAPIPNDFFLSGKKMVDVFASRARDAFDYFTKQGIDLHAFNTEQSADDVNDLRKALGVDKINILGFSYGTHLGLSVIRRHGDHLNRAILIGCEGPDHTAKLPLEGDRQVERISKLVAQDKELSKKVPDFTALVKRVMAKFEREPVKVKIKNRLGGSEDIELTIGKEGLQHLICRDLGDSNDIPMFPLAFYATEKGDYSFISALAERRYYQYRGGVQLMTFLMDAASGCSPARAKQIEREAKTAIFGNAMNLFAGDMDEAVGNPDLGEHFRSPIRTAVPTLFISGTLDWNTQPHQADETRRTFKTSEHIVVENAGHESMMNEPSIRENMLKWLRGESTNGFKMKLDLKFVPIP